MRTFHAITACLIVAALMAACSTASQTGTSATTSSGGTTGNSTTTGTTTAPGGSPTPSPTAVGQAGGPDITYFHMVNGSDGWAGTASLVARTTDGGQHWQTVTAAQCPASSTTTIATVFALDATDLWFICVHGTMIGSQTFALYRTSDSGQTWHSTALSVPQAQFIEGLTFVDASHGWFINSEGSATGHHFLVLYRTTDGGATWHEAAQTDGPGGLESGGLGAGPVFLNAVTGWFGDEIGAFDDTPDQFELRVTHDGGVTWSQQSLPPPHGSVLGVTSPPLFFDSRHGALLLPVFPAPITATNNQETLIYQTSDGGQTWVPQPLIPLALAHFTFSDAQHGWAVLDPDPPGVTPPCGPPVAARGLAPAGARSSPLPLVLDATSDGGQHWATRNTTLAWCNLAALDFISPLQGWAVLNPIQSTGPSVLVTTTDGGATWTPLTWNPQ